MVPWKGIIYAHASGPVGQFPRKTLKRSNRLVDTKNTKCTVFRIMITITYKTLVTHSSITLVTGTYLALHEEAVFMEKMPKVVDCLAQGNCESS